MKIARINENGREQIRWGLEMNCRPLTSGPILEKVIDAWATLCVLDYALTRECAFEIPAGLSATGNPMIVTLNADGYDVEDGKLTEKKWTVAWEQGYEAFLYGLDESANPYDPNSDQCLDWNDGFNAATEEYK